MSTNLIARKHWITYIPPAIVLLFGLLILFGSGHSSFFRLFSLAIILAAVSVMLRLNSVKWYLEGDMLHIEKGVLPWRKTQLSIPLFHIYESYVSYPMLGYFFKYSTISIKKTDGRASFEREHHMRGAKALSEQINFLATNFQREAYRRGRGF